MKILVLSFYFEPDLSAGSFRATALVQALRNRSNEFAEIEVVTTEPNRYSTYAASAAAKDAASGVQIRRIPLPAHTSDMRGQAKAFIHFARAAWRHTRGRQFDIVFATSSRLMTAVLGAAIARRARAPLYLDIRDIFVDTIKDVLPGTVAPFARASFGLVERWAMNRAQTINLVSRGFEAYFRARYPAARLCWFTNGIDDEFILPPSATIPPRDVGVIRVLYAGNIGDGQGLHAILPELAKLSAQRMHFVVIGDGGKRTRLIQSLQAAGVTNVELRVPVGRERLVEEYRSADVLFLHLNDYDAFKKVLPSKIFEYAAMGKPIWAGVAGFAAEFLRTEVSNAAVFRPCDAQAALQAFTSLKLADAPRREFIEKFRRSNIAREMAEDIVSCASGAVKRQQ